MKGFKYGLILLYIALVLLVLTFIFWFRDIIREATYQGHHTHKVRKGLQLGMLLFIVSEVFFFIAFFWAYFHSSLTPAIELGAIWPPKGIAILNPWNVPLLNTVLLLSSGATVTWAHFAIISGERREAILALSLTILFALLFTALQGYEYYEAAFTIADGVYGSTFFMATGLTIIDPIKYIKNYSTFNRDSNFPYWITGFSDAESYFTIRIGTRSNRNNSLSIIPVFGIELHEKDYDLLKQIQSFFGIGSIIRRIRNGNPSVIYSVQSIIDIEKIIIPHFKKYPMLTQKQADFELFCLIIDLMIKKEHLTKDGLSKLLAIKASMNKGLSEKLKKAFPDIIPISRPLIKNQIIANPYWLVGFVDGEGCFYVKITAKQTILTFSISQHIRDLALLNIIKFYLNCGVIETISTRPNQSTFITYTFSDNLEKIIPFFKQHSLLSVKSLNFQDFNQISLYIKNKEHLTSTGLYKIKILKSRMNSKRSYKSEFSENI